MAETSILCTRYAVCVVVSLVCIQGHACIRVWPEKPSTSHIPVCDDAKEITWLSDRSWVAFTRTCAHPISHDPHVLGWSCRRPKRCQRTNTSNKVIWYVSHFGGSIALAMFGIGRGIYRATIFGIAPSRCQYSCVLNTRQFVYGCLHMTYDIVKCEF